MQEFCGLSPTQGREKSRRMIPKRFTNCPALNKYGKAHDQGDETNSEEDEDAICALHMKLLDF